MPSQQTTGSGPWLTFLIVALALVIAAIVYVLSKGGLLGAPIDRLDRPKMVWAPLPDPPPLPKPVPAGAET